MLPTILIAKAAGGGKYTLSGTTGAGANMSTESETGANSATGNWEFQTHHVAELNLVRKTHLIAAAEPFRSGIEYANRAKLAVDEDLWIKATADTGSAPNNGGDAVGSWLAINGTGSSTRNWGWFRSFADPGTTTGTIKVELSTDASGVTIVATGYYGGTATTTG